jgi:hypothetical protein
MKLFIFYFFRISVLCLKKMKSGIGKWALEKLNRLEQCKV